MTAPSPSLSTALADRYRLDRELGAGGMATVYLAEDVRHGRKVAVKVLHPELSAVLGPERFLKEITLTASLQHPHILPLFDSGSAASQLYYVMPFVEGETLRARLERERQLPVADAVRIASEVADALAYAHTRGVVHRDIKPENILLQNGHALVADFGIALAVEQAGGQRMTQTGISLGTPHYMAPEQAMGERNVDQRADIYALGAVTYEMLAGEPPFVGPTAQAVVAKVITETPRPLAAQRPSVPAHVDEAVRTALEKLPADRFATADAFASALNTVNTPLSLPRPTTPGAGGARARRETIIATAVAIVATIAAVWGWAKVGRDANATNVGAPGVHPWLTTLALPDSAQPVGPFSLSPDGARFVYQARLRGLRQLWIRDAGSLEARPLAGIDSADYPVVSPDGRRVAFLSSNNLRVASLGDGRVTNIADLATHSLLAWADDENILISGRGGIQRIPLSGGARQPVTTIDTAHGEVFHTGPSPLPGGQSILFVVIPRNYGDNSQFRIAVSNPRTGAHRILLPGFWARYVEPGYLLVVRPDSALVAVPFDAKTQRTTDTPIVLAPNVTIPGNSFPQIAVASTGHIVFATGGATGARMRIARVRRDGTSTIVDSTWAGQAREIAASPDGMHAAAVVDRGTWDIQERDLRTGALSYVSIPATVATDPVFSSDGKSLLFIAGGPEGGRLYEVPVGIASAPRLVLGNAAANFYEPALSPDGRTIYYTMGMGGQRAIYAHRLDQEPGSSDRSVVATPARERSPRPSPDGRWLAYVSDESGVGEVYVRSTDATRAERWQVSASGGRVPRWARDGRELFYLSRDSLMVAAVSSDVQFRVGARRALFPMARFNGDSYDVLPGDSGFLMLQTESRAARMNHIVFVDRWTTLLAAAKGQR